MAQKATMRLPTPPAAVEYSIDAWQRSILFLDVLRRRAAQAEEHAAQTAPHVLDYEAEVVLDGRSLERPVNYALARIIPSEGVDIDPLKRPFVVVDPRAGHGPGIGGFKADSEIGVAMKAGHPCYFVGFLPDPVPGQTIEDIARAEAVFLETVIARHPEAEGKPCVIGNCQAGWAMMMVNALRPELFGPIIIAGSPLSYWAGVRGQEPDALLGRPARRLVADRADRRPRRRRLRRRLAGAELREPEPGEHPLDQAVQRLVQDRHRGRALPRLREVLGRPRAAQRRGDAVDRRRALRRQPPRRGRDPHLRRHRHRPAQHPLADRGLLLARRQHHPAAAGARLDPRPLRRRRRDPRPRPDHRLHHPRQDRASRHLRLGRRRAEGARRVRLEHRPDRRAARRASTRRC